MKSITVTDLAQTCGACPSQWEGTLDTGETIYVRYRWGTLRIGIGNNLTAAIETTTFTMNYGGGLDGSMDYETLQRLTPNISWPASC